MQFFSLVFIIIIVVSMIWDYFSIKNKLKGLQGYKILLYPLSGTIMTNFIGIFPISFCNNLEF